MMAAGSSARDALSAARAREWRVRERRGASSWWDVGGPADVHSLDLEALAAHDAWLRAAFSEVECDPLDDPEVECDPLDLECEYDPWSRTWGPADPEGLGWWSP